MESDISSNIIDERIEETKKLSSELLELRQTHSNLATECKEVEQILADMKSSLFGLRVGAQVFEQLNIQPLSEAVANIVENKRNKENKRKQNKKKYIYIYIYIYIYYH
jgi:hypothetical protein